MALNVAHEVAAMERLTVDQLRSKYADVFGEATRSRHREHLVARIAWRMQANAEGDLSERARRRAAELANDVDLRVRAPRMIPPPAPVVAAAASSGELMVGTQLTRRYKGRLIVVTVQSDGFEYQGERYKSLSAVARAVTGTHWNGHLFFNLRRKGGDQ